MICPETRWSLHVAPVVEDIGVSVVDGDVSLLDHGVSVVATVVDHSIHLY